MSREAFAELPDWKKLNLKRNVNLFWCLSLRFTAAHFITSVIHTFEKEHSQILITTLLVILPKCHLGCAPLSLSPSHHTFFRLNTIFIFYMFTCIISLQTSYS